MVADRRHELEDRGCGPGGRRGVRVVGRRAPTAARAGGVGRAVPIGDRPTAGRVASGVLAGVLDRESRRGDRTTVAGRQHRGDPNGRRGGARRRRTLPRGAARSHCRARAELGRPSEIRILGTCREVRRRRATCRSHGRIRPAVSTRLLSTRLLAGRLVAARHFGHLRSRPRASRRLGHGPGLRRVVSRRQRCPSRVSSMLIPSAASSSRSRSDVAQSRAARAASRAARSSAAPEGRSATSSGRIARTRSRARSRPRARPASAVDSDRSAIRRLSSRTRSNSAASAPEMLRSSSSAASNLARAASRTPGRSDASARSSTYASSA